jgi:alpha-N-arabinofuranosidase
MRLDDDLRQARGALDVTVGGAKPIGVTVDEWGVWHPQARVGGGHVQENTLRDALAAATVLDLFNDACDLVAMANLAQTVNVLQSVIRTEGEAFWLTATYYVFDLYRPHMGNTGVRTVAESDVVEAKRSDGSTHDLPLLSASASVDAKGKRAVVSLVNRSLDADLECRIRLDGGSAQSGCVKRLWAEAANAHNSAQHPDAVAPVGADCAASGSEWTEALPPHSLTVLQVNLA